MGRRGEMLADVVENKSLSGSLTFFLFNIEHKGMNCANALAGALWAIGLRLIFGGSNTKECF